MITLEQKGAKDIVSKIFKQMFKNKEEIIK